MYTDRYGGRIENALPSPSLRILCEWSPALLILTLCVCPPAPSTDIGILCVLPSATLKLPCVVAKLPPEFL